MTNEFDFTGIWKGEYVYDDRIYPVLVKASIPFILRIKPATEAGLFTGICQEDPEVSKIDFHAVILGAAHDYELYFVKKYAKTLINRNGSMLVGDEPHPEIIYRAKITDLNRIAGTWQMERTFRTIEGQLTELPKVAGDWWIVRL